MTDTPTAASGNAREERARECLAKALEGHPNGYGSYARIVRNDEYSNTTLEAALTPTAPTIVPSARTNETEE